MEALQSSALTWEAQFRGGAGTPELTAGRHTETVWVKTQLPDFSSSSLPQWVPSVSEVYKQHKRAGSGVHYPQSTPLNEVHQLH